ncbi:MAG: aldo/keto reductase [Lachnospiraceae bacterium]|nr:aldo/keto reductase [Lachnospiraceae bacterium]
MKKMKIGKSGVEAPVLVLGSFGMGGGTSWQDTTDNDQELIDFIKEAHKEGICGIDTAPVYGTGRSERIVGQAIKEDRAGWYLSTKCAMQWRTAEGIHKYDRDGKSVYANFKKDSIIQDVEDSLKRLETDYIDMMIVHQPPAMEEVKEVMEALQSLKDSGKIKAIGLSNTCLTDHAIDLVKEALKYGQVDLVQEHASLLFRNNLGDFLKLCEQEQITFQDYSGLEKGALAGKIIEGVTEMAGDNRSKYKWFQPDGVAKLNDLTRALTPIAEKYGCTIPVLVLAWLRQQSPVMNLLVGARKMQSIKDTMKVLDVTISDEDLKEMSRLSDIANA